VLLRRRAANNRQKEGTKDTKHTKKKLQIVLISQMRLGVWA
jgi:hypothetical protein